MAMMDIPAQVLQQTCDYIAQPPTYIINLSFRCGVFHKPMKAKAISIYKCGSKTEMNYYRLISALPSVNHTSLM